MTKFNQLQQFQMPDVQYRSRPFWAWNGRIEEKEAKRQLDLFKKMGYGGVFIHSRVGLKTEYLGNEWMKLVDTCIEYGHSIGLEMWIYDEDRWPSGTAGGLVTKKPENRTMHLLLSKEDTLQVDDTKKKNPVASYFIQKDGEHIISYRECEKGMVPKKGEELYIVTKEMSPNNDNYNGYTYLNTMKPEAVEDYLVSTYDEYPSKLSAKSMKKSLGMFTDEPHRGAYLSPFSEGNIFSIPYTENLFPEFRKRYGYELKSHLPEIYFRKENEPLSKVARDYLELAEELFLQHFMKALHERCLKNDWLFTGHVLQEDSLCSQTAMIGSVMSAYEYMDVPGIDLLGERTNCFWIGKQLTSVAHQTGKAHTLTELFGCTGWQMKWENYKNIGDWQAMMGIDTFCPHLCWYTMEGENKRDYPTSMSFQSAWYPEMKQLEDYFARIHVMTQGQPTGRELLVLHPIESVWARIYSGALTWLDSKDKDIQRLEKHFADTFHMLMNAGIDFDYGEERLLSRYAKVENGQLVVGKASYQKLLITGVETIRESTRTLIEQFVEEGGEVIIAGDTPSYVDCKTDAGLDKLWKKAVRIPFSKRELAKACAPKDVVWKMENHGASCFLQCFDTADFSTAVILNVNRSKKTGPITLRTTQAGSCYEFHPLDGSITDAEEMFTLAPGELKIYTVPKKTKLLSEIQKEKHTSILKDAKEVIREEIKYCKQPVDKKYSYSLSEDNVAVLDVVKVEEISGKHQNILSSKIEVLRADRLVRDHLSMSYRGGEMLQPWYVAKYKKEILTDRTPIGVTYSFFLDQKGEKISLGLEEYDELLEVRINGKKLPKEQKEKGFYIDPCIERFTIPETMLKKGCNQITLVHNYGVNSGLEAIYLLGDFGVRIADGTSVHIGSKPNTLESGDITTQGFPFYSGSITYRLPEKLTNIHRIRFPELLAFDATVQEGNKKHTICCAPYCAEVHEVSSITMNFNRRNTLGPLHVPVSYKGGYGPDTFLTRGAMWREHLQLYPQGLPMYVEVF